MIEINYKLIYKYLERLQSEDYCDLGWNKRLSILGGGDPPYNCDHGKDDFKYSKEILKKMGLEAPQIKKILSVAKKNGGTCDCKIILKAESSLLQYKNWANTKGEKYV